MFCYISLEEIALRLCFWVSYFKDKKGRTVEVEILKEFVKKYKTRCQCKKYRNTTPWSAYPEDDKKKKKQTLTSMREKTVQGSPGSYSLDQDYLPPENGTGVRERNYMALCNVPT